MENEHFLSEQIITYLGNKRKLLSFIGQGIIEVQNRLNKKKLKIADLFSGSGIVSRYLKQYSDILYVNDLEDYCYTINKCYLTNSDEKLNDRLKNIYNYLKNELTINSFKEGFIQQLYAPKDDTKIIKDERVFYTTRNAKFLDTTRQLISNLDEEDQPFFLAPLLYGASVHTNTAGHFKSFYKDSKTGIGKFGGNGANALLRITGEIELLMPLFSNFNCETEIFKLDANILVDMLPELDLTYLDPPYNEHPYGSNYFMLNIINNYIEPKEISKVSGIPKNWNRSEYNKKKLATAKLKELCDKINSKFILISLNNESIIEDPIKLFNSIGQTTILEQDYNTYKGSRNLSARAKKTKEYLYLIEK